ncbi:MAG TPA: cytochrome c oxidase subunit 3 [Polyangiaceae bacterium]
MPTSVSHFESGEQQTQAARLGMWIFLGSELLLFAGLFALYAASRAAMPAAFHAAIAHSEKILGSINTGVLLVSSTLAALSVRALEQGNRRGCLLALGGTLLLAATFLGIKVTEYGLHFREGIFPGGSTTGERGAPIFWTLYFVSTGLHAIHVLVGMGVLSLAARGVARGQIPRERAYVLENATLYWHLVDLIWIFLWPLYYLA